MFGTANTQWVLVADDDSELREALRENLMNRLSVRVMEASSGQEALLKMQNQHFHLVITDYQMPRTNGAVFIHEINRMPERQKPDGIIMMSGVISVDELAGLGPVTFLAKPLGIDDLIEASRCLLSGEEFKLNPTSHKVDVAYINPFVEGTLNVLETMCSTPSEKQDVFIRGEHAVSGDVSAIVAICSEGYQGSFAVSFETQCYLGLVNRMLGESYTEINQENQDAAGELCNQIFGLAKQKLNEIGHQVRPAIPSVVASPSHQITHLIKGVVIAARFRTEFGSFVVEAAVDSSK